MILNALKSLDGNPHYINRYFKFIESCRESSEGYTEGHHILPRSLFKQYESESWNIIELTARQHFVAHIMLAKAYGGSMWAALHMMSNCNQDGKRTYKFTSRLYCTMKLGYIKLLSERMSGSGNPMYGTSRSGELNPMFGKKHSAAALEKQSQARVAYFSDEDNRMVGAKNGMYGKTHSEEARGLISNSMLGELNHNFGKPMSDDVKAKLSETMSGRVLTDEHKDKMSKALKGVKKPESHGKNVAAAKLGKRKVWTETGFIWVHKDALNEYFMRNGKYYNYDVL